MGLIFDDDRDPKRNLGERDKKTLYYDIAQKKCQNCGKEIEYRDMQVGHRKAWSKGGRTTLKNSVCLCYTCNNAQGNYNWSTFLKRQGKEDKEKSMKEALGELTLAQLKTLAEKHHIKVKGTTDEGIIFSSKNSPKKRQYIFKLKGIVSKDEIKLLRTEQPIIKKKKRKKKDSWW